MSAGLKKSALPQTEMGAGIAASPHCAERRIYRFSWSRSRGTASLKSKFTSSGVASHLTTPSEEETDRLPDCATRGFACLPTIGAWQSQSHPTFRGPSWVNHSSVSLCPSTRRLPNRVALEEDQLFRRLFPTDPAKSRGNFTLPVGGDRSFRHPPLPFLPLPAFRWRRGLPSRSLGYNAQAFRVAEGKNAFRSLWIMGISGTTVGTFRDRRKCCRSVPAHVPG